MFCQKLKLFVEWKMGKLDMSGANCLIVQLVQTYKYFHNFRC